MGITVRGKMLQKALVSEGDKAYSNKNSISTKATKFTIIGIHGSVVFKKVSFNHTP